MEKIIFEIETITPMFLSGADQSKAELRAASIKGLLRFWWRALQAESDLDTLREREGKIFGSADEKKGGGSSFSIMVSHEGALKRVKKPFPDNPVYKVPIPGKTFKMNILEYLAYGAFDSKKGFRGDYVDSGQRFNVTISVFKEAFINDILKTMYVFSLFGGIGSRNRNGFGSFSIVNVIEAYEGIRDSFSIDKPYEKKNLEKLIKKTNVASYSSFSEGTDVFRTKKLFNTSFDALADVGKIYKNARSSLEKTHHFDKRQYIGAPLNPPKESFKSILDRHAKPYFIKVAKEGNKYCAYILFLPSRYCVELNNAQQHDKMFSQVCTEFNDFLSQNMETIL
jgi:CRISPR-associated protein Cmr1